MVCLVKFFLELENICDSLIYITLTFLKSDHLWNIALTYRRINPTQHETFYCIQRRSIRVIKDTVPSTNSRP